MWLNDLKVALVKQDTKRLGELLAEMPEFQKNEDLKSALYLTKEAIKLVEKLKGDTVKSMRQIRKSIDFLESTKREEKTRLDIMS